MIEVSSDKFYEIIGPMDVIVTPVGDHYPYKTVFKFRSGVLVGYEEHEKYFVKKEYVENGKVQ